MKPIHTKAFMIVGFIGSLLIAFYCAEQKISRYPETGCALLPAASAEPMLSATPSFHKRAGSLINGELGQKWIDNYSHKNKTQYSYLISSSLWRMMLSNKNCIGISLYNSKDDIGRVHILPIAVNIDGNFINTDKVPTESGLISWTEAMRWIKKDNSIVQAHFFGLDAFEFLITKRNSTSIKISIAVNDKNETELLLSNGTASKPLDFVGGAINCPPVCVYPDPKK